VTFFQRVRGSEFQTGPSRFSYETIDIKSLSDWNTGWFSVADLFTVVTAPWGPSLRRWIFSKAFQLLYPAPIFHVEKCPGTRDRALGHPKVHAEDSTVL